MRIQNNYTANALTRNNTSFKGVSEAIPGALIHAASIAQDKGQSERFARSFRALNEASDGYCVRLTPMNDQGVIVEAIDEKTDETLELLSVSIDDFSWAMEQASIKLEKRKLEAQAARELYSKIYELNGGSAQDAVERVISRVG